MGLNQVLGHNRLVAALWGFAEATLFFIVPDVWLSFVALHRGFRSALWAACFAVCGAVIGGALVYAASVGNPAMTTTTIDAVPAISAGLINDVRVSLEHDGLWAMFLGSLTGVPYKIFASQAAVNGIELTNFALATIPARAFRFIAVAGVTVMIARLLLARASSRLKIRILAGCWVVFYSFYFTLMPN